MTDYRFNEFYIPAHMLESLEAYIREGRPVGDFLTAVLSNDLVGACGRADDINIRNLPAYCSYLYNEAPLPCWGSKVAVQKWLDQHARERAEQEKR